VDLTRIRADFDEIARLGDRYESGTDRFDELLHSRVPVDATRVLDVGCGTGRLTIRLIEPGRSCVGVDVSPEMIRRAERRGAGLKGVSFVCGDFLEMESDPVGFDCVVSAAALHHMPVEAAIDRMKQVLRPRGRLIIHDLRASEGLRDEIDGWSMIAREAMSRLARRGWPLSPRAVRRAWARHGAGERYLDYRDVTELAGRLLPGAEVLRHPMWRYTIVWDKSS
jgi:ubiquinone/menaquinone biosynthesis C-methylase UbiE